MARIQQAIHSMARVRGTLVAVLSFLVLAVSGCGGGGGGSGPDTSAPTSQAPLSQFGIVNVPVPTGGSGSSSGGTGGGGGQTAANLDPTSVPGFPSGLPPAVTPARAATQAQSATAITYSLPAGWSVISFPFASLNSVSGLARQLYAYTGGTFSTVDPVKAPETVDCRLAYFAYCDAPTTVTVNGNDNSAGTVKTVALIPGWNLIGCPSATNIPYSKMTVTRIGASRVFEECTGATLTPTDTWLSQYAYGLGSGSFGADDLQGTGSLPTRQGRYVFVWQDLELNFNPVAPASLPTINTLSASTIAKGATLTINGSGFGTVANARQVTIGGIPVPAADILSWSTTAISLTVPNVAKSGKVVVFVDRYASNRLNILVTGGGGGTGTGTLTGTVLNRLTNAPLQGCQIMLDSGEVTVSDASGNWSLTGLEPGERLLFATLLGYQTGVGLVTVQSNANRTVGVLLSPGSSGGGGGGGGGGGSTTGTLYVKAYRYGGYGVRRIEVVQAGNLARFDTFDQTDFGDTYEELTCSGAAIGKTFNIKVTWWSGLTRTITKTFYRDGDSETIYNP